MRTLHAREERSPSGTYRPNLLLYWLGRLARPVVAEAMRQRNHDMNQAMWRWSFPNRVSSQNPATPQSSPGQSQ